MHQIDSVGKKSVDLFKKAKYLIPIAFIQR
jgi:hypothetical protein